jgi:hypothetical protein
LAAIILASFGKNSRLQKKIGNANLECMDKKSAPTVRDLYPHLNEEELTEVEDTWERYLALVLRIFERLESETDSPSDHLTQNADEILCSS